MRWPWRAAVPTTTARTPRAQRSSSSCPSGTLNGEGSSAQKNAIEEAIAAFGDQCSGAKVNYNPTGSGAGIKQFIAGQVDFAGSDSALNSDKGEPADAAKRCQGNPAWNLPMVTGPIAVAYKLSGVDKLIVTPELAANIFSGKITTWNDPAIAKVNPDAKLPSTKISVFFRSDESGTTENFTKWLHAAAPDAWTADPGKQWTGKGEGKEKSAGVADGVNTTEGGITYVEWSYAKDAKLGMAQVDNGGGPVELTADTVAKSVATATQMGTGNDLAAQAGLRHQGARRLPGHPGDLRGRLQQGPGRRQDQAPEVLPDALRRHGLPEDPAGPGLRTAARGPADQGGRVRRGDQLTEAPTPRRLSRALPAHRRGGWLPSHDNETDERLRCP